MNYEMVVLLRDYVLSITRGILLSYVYHMGLSKVICFGSLWLNCAVMHSF